MKLRIVFCSAVLICPAALVGQLSVPKVGVARYADHTVRGVNGLEANLIVDDQVLSGADAVSFSDSGGLISTGGKLQLITLQGAAVGEFNSNESSPVVNIDGALTTAIAWLPSRSSLIYWNGKSFAETQVNGADIPGDVTSVRLAGTTSASLLASDGRGNVFETSVSLENGTVLSFNLLPGVKGPAFAQSGFIVSPGAKGLEIQAPNGVIRTLPLNAPSVTFERMSSEWVHISSPSTHQDWALHLTSKALQLSLLPGPSSTAGASQMRRPKEPEK